MTAEEEWAGYRSFLWRRADRTRHRFELRGGSGSGPLLANLALGELASTATSTSSGERLVFTLEGGDRRIRASDAGRLAILASFERGWTSWNGTVRFADGRQLAWHRPGIWRGPHAFSDRGIPLMHFNPGGVVLVHGLGARPEPAIRSWRELLLLLCLGWLLLGQGGAAGPTLLARVA